MPPSATCAIAWLPWSATAFTRARDEGKPVLLSIVTAWSSACEEMDRTSYADAEVARLIADRFVAVRVDADRRPDISARYTLGGWPTTAFLTAEGDVLGGGTFVSAERLTRALDQVAGALHDGDPPTAAVADEPPSPSVMDAAELQRLVFDSFDGDAGAFGGPPRFPHAAPVHLALSLAREQPGGDYANVAITCLDAMGWGGLYDEADGGFFRCARGPGWTNAQSEKLLDVNASMLSLYLDAFETLGLARYAERAQDVLGYVQQTLADAKGGWAASQRDDPGYYALDDAAARRARPAPDVDRTLLAAPVAAMVSAALRAGGVMNDAGLRTFALQSLERIVLRYYRPGAGLAHCVDGDVEVRGLLDDQVAGASALLDAYAVTDDVVYRMMAEELARQAIVACRDAVAGGFFDRAASAHDVGLLRRRPKPFVANCEASRMLRRLAAATGDAEFDALAVEALAAVAAQAPSHGPLAAGYVLAVREAGLR